MIAESPKPRRTTAVIASPLSFISNYGFEANSGLKDVPDRPAKESGAGTRGLHIRNGGLAMDKVYYTSETVRLGVFEASIEDFLLLAALSALGGGTITFGMLRLRQRSPS